jgi:hypothetical protein
MNDEVPVKSARVRLLMFSGRPDPEWDLDDDVLGDLSSRIRLGLDAPPTEQSAAPPLGYRGFVIVTPAELTDLPPQTTVFGGAISIGVGPFAEVHEDAGGVEQLLLEDARRHDWGDALRAMGAPDNLEPS